MFILQINLIILIILQVSAYLGIADHVWQDSSKRAAIAEGAETWKAQISVGGDTLVIPDWVDPRVRCWKLESPVMKMTNVMIWGMNTNTNIILFLP